MCFPIARDLSYPTSTVTAGLPCRVPPIACNISSSLAAYRERMRLSTSAASPAFGLNKRLADFVDRNEISSDRQNKDRSLGELRLAPFFRDGLEIDPQDVVGREVNPRVPVAALHRQLLRNAYPSGICRGRCCDNKAGTYPAGPGGGKGESPSLPERWLCDDAPAEALTLCICWPVQADAEPRAQHRPHHRRQSQRHRPPHHQAPAAHRSRPGAHANLDGEEASAPRPTTSRTADPPPP